MGRTLADAFAAARAVFDEADDALGFPLSRLCFEGPDEQLKLTENTQPALLTVSIAAQRVLTENGVVPDYVAGHSLGEYSALVAAGSLTFTDAVRLVRKRGQYMQEVVPAGVGAMAALLKLPAGKLDAILLEAAQGEGVGAANLNSPDQTVIAGHAGAVQRAADLAKAAGAKRAVILAVSAPFHSPLMEPAALKMRDALDAVTIRPPAVPIISNVTAAETNEPDTIRRLLVEQVTSRVRWRETVLSLRGLGVEMTVEAGGGKVLTGMVKRIDPELVLIPLDTPADIEAFAKTL